MNSEEVCGLCSHVHKQTVCDCGCRLIPQHEWTRRSVVLNYSYLPLMRAMNAHRVVWLAQQVIDEFEWSLKCLSLERVKYDSEESRWAVIRGGLQ